MEQRGQLITAIFNYNEFGEGGIPLDPLCDMAFSLICDTLDRDRQAYEERCLKNKNNAKKGGRPKKTDRFSNETQKPYNDNDNDIDIDIDIDNDNENENGSGDINDNEYSNVNTAASTATSPATDAPRIAQEVKEKLIAWGIPERYVEYVEPRAAYYAKLQGKDVGVVIGEWWNKDRANPKWSEDGERKTDQKANTRMENKGSAPYNAEIEDWAQACLKKLWGEDQACSDLEL